eukprot:598715-Pelagomonas_calceolata.AAC.6
MEVLDGTCPLSIVIDIRVQSERVEEGGYEYIPGAVEAQVRQVNLSFSDSDNTICPVVGVWQDSMQMDVRSRLVP